MDYSGKIIRKTPVVPTQQSASGVWTLDDALQATKSNTWPIANVPDPMSRSLRFRSSASAYLNRTPASAGNQKTWTWSAWVKRGKIGGEQCLFNAGQNVTGGVDQELQLRFNSDSTIEVSEYKNSTNTFVVATTPVYRDPSAWYHIVLAFDTTQATASNRVKLYVNGVQVTSFATATYPSLNTDYSVNRVTPHYIGILQQDGTPSLIPFDGYLTEINFIDGQALTPSSFGGTNAVTGVWEPRPYTGTYGTNGFLLTFSDITSTATLGNDTSGNSNNWTTNNISLTAGSTYDSMLDVPTQWVGYNTGDVASVTRGNYATWNPLVSTFSGSTFTFSNANLAALVSVQTVYPPPAVSTMPLLSSGKTYCEITLSAQGRANTWKVGITKDPRSSGSASFGNTAGDYSWEVNGGISPTNPVILNNGSNLGFYGSAITTNDVVMLAYDGSTGKLWLGKNGTFFSSGDPAAGTNAGLSSLTGDFYVGVSTGGTTNDTNTYQVNFGQRPFAYTPPAGFLSLCTTNLPSPTILQGNQYFDATLFTSAGTTDVNVVNVGGFAPDLVWFKDRPTAGTWHTLVDRVRGNNLTLSSNQTDQEYNILDNGYTGRKLVLNSNGFTINDAYNAPSPDSIVGWQWRASNATAVTNTAGSITSTVSANTTAGFSIVTYTGTGANATVGHGLGVAPKMIIVKRRTTAGGDWQTYHASLGATKFIKLNTTDAAGTATSPWNDTAPTSTVFSLGTNGDTNLSASNLVAYCFSEVAGYSKFGSYTGNGSADGTFVFTGFRPRYVMIKRADSTSSWAIFDTSRNTFNVTDNNLFANLSDAESTFTVLDILSNGFKIRTTLAGSNASGGTYIYMAFAESPFKNALAR